MKKVFLLLVVIILAIVGLWLYEGKDGSLHSMIGKASPDMPLMNSKKMSKDDDSVKLTVPASQDKQVSVPIIQKPMSKKIDPALLGNVPSFNFSSLYNSVSDSKITSDLKQIDDSVNQFIKDYKGKVAKLTALGLFNAIKKYETIMESKYKISEIAFLSRNLDVTDSVANKFNSQIEQKEADFDSKLKFFELEINKMTDLQLNNLYKDKKAPNLITYKPFLSDVRKFAKYTLSSEMEELSIKKSITSNDAWADLYSNILSTIILKVNDESYTISQASSLFFDSEPLIRKTVSDEVGKNFKNNAMALTLSINSIMKDKRVEDSIRGYANPISSRNLSNSVDDVAVNSLMTTVKNNYSQTIQKYYKIKAKLLGIPKLAYSDRLAPMPFSSNNDKVITFSDAQNIVIDSYKAFSPQMADVASKFFSNGWIDARLLPNKIGGAFCDLGVPSNHPFILLNYNGKNRDVMTLAHEIGHGIHSILSYPNGMLMFAPGLTVAETASLFGEKLTFNNLLSKTQNNKEKATLMATKIEENLNAIVNAIAIADFENKIHAASKDGDLSVDDINKIWLNTLTEMYGDTVSFGEYDAYRWAGISHIFKTPFYYYAYSFSQLVVDSLYDVYDKKLIPDFEKQIIAMLSSGSTKNYKELLAPFKLDPLKSDFWQNGINITIKMIDDFDTLINNDSDIQSSIKAANLASGAMDSTAIKVSVSDSQATNNTNKVAPTVNMVSDQSIMNDIKHNPSDAKIVVTVTDNTPPVMEKPKFVSTVVDNGMQGSPLHKDAVSSSPIASKNTDSGNTSKNLDSVIVKLPK